MAQKDTTGKAADRITVFDRNSSLSPFTGYYVDTTKNKKKWNVLKVNPELLIAGDLPFYYERQLTKNMTMEGSIGFTFQDYYFLLGNEDFSFYYYNDKEIWKTGISLKTDLKYFFGQNNVIDGFYISPEISFRRNTILYPIYDFNDVPTNNYLKGFYSFTDIKAVFGYEGPLFDSDYAIADVYAGLGVRIRDVEYNNFNQDAYPVINTNILMNSIVLKPHVYLGIKLGFKIR